MEKNKLVVRYLLFTFTSLCGMSQLCANHRKEITSNLNMSQHSNNRPNKAAVPITPTTTQFYTVLSQVSQWRENTIFMSDHKNNFPREVSLLYKNIINEQNACWCQLLRSHWPLVSFPLHTYQAVTQIHLVWEVDKEQTQLLLLRQRNRLLHTYTSEK